MLIHDDLLEDKTWNWVNYYKMWFLSNLNWVKVFSKKTWIYVLNYWFINDSFLERNTMKERTCQLGQNKIPCHFHHKSSTRLTANTWLHHRTTSRLQGQYYNHIRGWVITKNNNIKLFKKLLLRTEHYFILLEPLGLKKKIKTNKNT